jgi:hypothetical protein
MGDKAAQALQLWHDAGDPTSLQGVANAAANAAVVKLTPSVESANNMVVFVNNLRTAWHFIPENVLVDFLVAILLLSAIIFLISVTCRKIGGLGWIMAQISLFFLVIVLLAWTLLTLVLEAKIIGGPTGLFFKQTPVTAAPVAAQDVSWFGWAMGVGNDATKMNAE